MLRYRVIPVLLLRGMGLVKSIQFKKHRYVGDVLNAVKIFNEKEVDEIIVLDITATPENKKPDYKIISDIASECFMPFGYGGGVKSIDEIGEIFKLGAEKVIINTSAVHDREMVEKAVKEFGSQSIVAALDVSRRGLFGKLRVYTNGGRNKTKHAPVDMAKKMEQSGVGEIVINSIDKEGVMKGYDLDLIQAITSAVSVPVVACGGAGKIQDFADAINIGGASAVAAGSMFVFQGIHRAVLISYPKYQDLELVLNS